MSQGTDIRKLRRVLDRSRYSRVPAVGATLRGPPPRKRRGTMGGPVWPRNRPTLLVAGFGPGVGVGEGARSASSPGWGGWRGAASRVRSRTGGPHLRANDRGGAPSSRRDASCSHRPAPPAATGAAEFLKPGNLPAASPGPPVREQSQESAREPALRAWGQDGDARQLSRRPDVSSPRSQQAEGRGA